MSERRERILVQGLIAGAIGYAVVVVFFAIANAVAGRSPLFTAAVLGHALLGERSTAVAAAPVAVYNGLHLVVFLLIGTVAAWLVAVVERRPELWYLLLFLAVFAFFHLFGAVAALATPAGDVLPLSLVLVASLLATGAMAGWLWRANPRLGARIREAGDLEDPLPGR